jgi:hypothetical protein
MNIDNNNIPNTDNVTGAGEKTSSDAGLHTEISNTPDTKTNANRIKDNAGYLIVMAISIVLLYIVNNLFVDAITPLEPYVISTYPKFLVAIINFFSNLHSLIFSGDLVKYLWSINLALALSIVGNLVLLIWRPRWFLHLFKAFLLGIAVLPVYLVLTRFPFVVQSHIWQTVIRIFLITLLSALIVVFIFEAVRFVLALLDKIRKDRSRVSHDPAPVTEASGPTTKE